MDQYDEDEARGRYAWRDYDPRTRGWGTKITTPADDLEPVAMEGWDLI